MGGGNEENACEISGFCIMHKCWQKSYISGVQGVRVEIKRALGLTLCETHDQHEHLI